MRGRYIPASDWLEKEIRSRSNITADGIQRTISVSRSGNKSLKIRKRMGKTSGIKRHLRCDGYLLAILDQDT